MITILAVCFTLKMIKLSNSFAPKENALLWSYAIVQAKELVKWLDGNDDDGGGGVGQKEGINMFLKSLSFLCGRVLVGVYLSGKISNVNLIVFN